MSEKPVRFGILGCANIARKFARAILLAPNATIQAVGSRSAEKAARFAAENGFPSTAKMYGNYEAVLDDPDVDAVYVPLPTSLHVKWALLVAEKKKHLLLEKPVALSTPEFDQILATCEANGVQFMDGTMWMHHPRTLKMREFLSDPNGFGKLKTIHVTFCRDVGPDILQNNIRVKPHLDALGALSNVGRYCIRAILWAVDYRLPTTATALREPEIDQNGAILSCSATFSWGNGTAATFYCSFLLTAFLLFFLSFLLFLSFYFHIIWGWTPHFLANFTMDITCLGNKGSLCVHDFVIPCEEDTASFYVSSRSRFKELAVGCELAPEEQTEFARLVASIRDGSSELEKKWAVISRKMQLVLDAIKASVDRGFEPVEVVK
ncbi:D-xylose 1-dehydrogenase (NADP(+)) [Bertholletia excelsa]